MSLILGGLVKKGLRVQEFRGPIVKHEFGGGGGAGVALCWHAFLAVEVF